jgi:hypothetical protein
MHVHAVPRGVPRRPIAVAGLVAALGGVLVFSGALLPWLSLYGGLERLTGFAGRNGKLLAAGGALCVITGLWFSVRGGRALRFVIGGLGFLLAAFSADLLAQLLAAYRSLEGGLTFASLGPGLFVSGAGAVLVLGTVFLGDRGSVTAARATTVEEGSLVHTVVYGLALLSAGAGIIHLSVVTEHMHEAWMFGAFFIASGIAQLAWAVLASGPVSRRAILAACIGNAAILALWVVSRTSGLPIGPEPGTPEAVGFADIVATVYEALIVIGSLWLLRSQDRPVGAGLVRFVRRLSLAILLPLTLAAALWGAGVFAPGPMHM